MAKTNMAKTNKVAIVTGSATGLGAACAIDLAGRGWNVAINYTKSKKEADETYAAVKAKGVEAILVQADMGQDADCRKLAAETLKKWGRIDGLVNNAGTTKFQSQGDLDGVTPEDFDRILRVNVTGPYMMSRAVYPDDEEAVGRATRSAARSSTSPRSRASWASAPRSPTPRSKGALNTLTLSLARWFGPAVRVNTVCPGFIQTRWLLGALGPGELREAARCPGGDHAAPPGRHARADGRGGDLLPDQRQQHHRRIPDRRCRHPSRQPADEGAVGPSLPLGGHVLPAP